MALDKEVDSLDSLGLTETTELTRRRKWNSVTRRGRGEILIFLGMEWGAIYGVWEDPLLSFLSCAGKGMMERGPLFVALLFLNAFCMYVQLSMCLCLCAHSLITKQFIVAFIFTELEVISY